MLKQQIIILGCSNSVQSEKHLQGRFYISCSLSRLVTPRITPVVISSLLNTSEHVCCLIFAIYRPWRAVTLAESIFIKWSSQGQILLKSPLREVPGSLKTPFDRMFHFRQQHVLWSLHVSITECMFCLHLSVWVCFCTLVYSLPWLVMSGFFERT